MNETSPFPGKKLIEALTTLFPGASRSSIKQWILHGLIRVNGKTVKLPHHIIMAGDRIEYFRSQNPADKRLYPFSLFYEDQYLMLVEKPAGILTYGEKGTGGTSLYKELSGFLRDKTNIKEQLFVVHRLDREVSGIVMFAKTEKIQQLMKDNWKKTRKLYLALVEGVVTQQEGTIRSLLTEGPDQRVYSTREGKGARQAITHYRVKEVIAGNTLVEVELETGRKNQIRVHLSEMGHPVVGDYRYGADNKIRRRIRLHATYFSFYHPITKRFHEYRSPLPKGFLVLKPEDEKYK